MRTNRPIWLALALLSGCARYEPRPLEPDRVLRELQEADRTLPVAPAFDPRDGLSDVEAVSLALLINPGLKAERARKGVAEAQLLAAGLYPDPEMDARWIARSDGTLLEGSLLAALDTAGIRGLRREKARLRVSEVDLEIADAERRAAGEVRASFQDLLAAEEGVTLAREGLALAEKILDRIRARQEAGAASGLDLTLASLEAARRRRDLGKAEREREDARRRLNRRIGFGPEVRLPLQREDPGIQDMAPGDPGRLEEIALSRRPDLAAARTAYEQAERDLAIATRGQYPRLSIGPSYNKEEDNDGFGIGAGIVVPAWNRNRGEIAERLAERQRLAEAFRAALAALRADLAEALAEAERHSALLDAYEREIRPGLERAAALAAEAIQAGKTDAAPLLALQDSILSGRREGLEARTLRRKALLRIEDVLNAPLRREP